jgi:hypothetical protein
VAIKIITNEKKKRKEKKNGVKEKLRKRKRKIKLRRHVGRPHTCKVKGCLALHEKEEWKGHLALPKEKKKKKKKKEKGSVRRTCASLKNKREKRQPLSIRPERETK